MRDGVRPPPPSPDSPTSLVDPPNSTSAYAAPRGVRGALRHTFASLENPAYARYFWGTAAFFFAMQMQMLLRGYLIFDLTGDPFALGLISVTFALPMLVLGPVAGVVADRIDRRTIVVVSQTISLVLTGITTALILTDTIAYWHLLVISLFAASVMTFNMPARQAIVPQLVVPEQLTNAIALNSGLMNASRIVAPALAGLLVAPIGVGGGYIVTMACNVLAVLLFARIDVPAPVRSGPPRSFLGDMADGVRYVRGNRLLLLLLLVGTVPMLLAMPHQNLLPVFTADVWDVGAPGLGLLQAMAGIGGLAGAAVAANLGSVRRQATAMTAGFVLFGVFITLFALSPTFAPALLLVLLGDLCAMIGMTLNNAIVQRTIPDAMRGRVMSLLMMTFGITPLGTLPAGWIARAYGVRVAVALGGLLLIIFSVLIFAISRTYRRLDHGSGMDESNLRPAKAPVGGQVGALSGD